MAQNLESSEYVDDDYIDMEVSSYTNLFSTHSVPVVSSPQHHHQREFEFQMSSKSLEKEPTTSPADELFYKGKLLPLHLPPRLQMVEKLLENSTISAFDHPIHNNISDTFEDFFSTPMITTTTTPTTTSTPFESCNISPSESCRVSRELYPEEYFYEYSTEESGFVKKSWTKKLKLIKHTSLGSKLKASRAYFKSLFSKSACSDDSSAAPARHIEEESIPKANESSSKYMKVAKRTPFGLIQSNRYQMSTTAKKSYDKEKITPDVGGSHRRSFSGAIKRHLTNKSSSSSSSSASSSSSSSSSNSNGFHELQFLKRTGSANSEIETSIQGAIAHCKQSQQQLFRSRKTISEVAFFSFSSVCEEHVRPGLCRG